MHLARTLTLAFSLAICVFSPAHAQVAIDISVDVAPPPLPVYDQPPIPEPGYLWVPGYWTWSDDIGYFWVPGTWVLPPEPELLWTPGYWGWSDGRYVFYDGYWGAQIGFYGGVVYGFGYTGQGYEGGYWRNGNFFYNRSVNNISNVAIANVYNKTVIVNNTTNVSYNGGAGGATAKPTPEQLAAEKEHHVAATPEQTRHVEAAAKDPTLSLASNHGHPTVAATTHPAQFKGPGIIAAHPGKPIAAVSPQGHRVVAPGNAVTSPANKAVPEEHKANVGRSVTPGPGTKVGPETREHKGPAGGAAAPGSVPTTEPKKLPTTVTHPQTPQTAKPTPPPPPPAAHAATPPPPPPPARAAAPPPPRPAPPPAKPKCPPDQRC